MICFAASNFIIKSIRSYDARKSFFVAKFWKYEFGLGLGQSIRASSEPKPDESFQIFYKRRFFTLRFSIHPRPTVTITWPVLSSHVPLNVIFMNNMNFRRNKLEWFKLDGVLLIRLIRYPARFNKNFSLNHWIHHVSNWTVIPRQCSRTFHHLDSKTFSSNSSETHSGSF